MASSSYAATACRTAPTCQHGTAGIFELPPEGQLPGFSGRLNIGSSKGQSKYNAFYLQAEKPWTDESQWGTTLALTISKAKSNQAEQYGEAEMWNAGEQDAYGWQRVFGLEDWRFVETGIVGLPLGFRASTTCRLVGASLWLGRLSVVQRSRHLQAAGQHSLQAGRPSPGEDLHDALGPRGHGRFPDLQPV